MDFKITFWGVRGSKPTPGMNTMLFGGNTSCVQIETKERNFIFDGGTGIYNLGKNLASREKPIEADIFFSHLHWDHIQGMPFFSPMFMADNEFRLYGQDKEGKMFKEIIEGQMNSPYFPITMEMMKSKFEFISIYSNQELNFGDTRITTFSVNHPNECLAFKVEKPNSKIIYATDTGPIAGNSFIEFIKGADIFIYDTHFTDAEYYGTDGSGDKKHWGHSTWEEGIRISQEANIGRLILYHHKEDRTDKEQQKIEILAQEKFKNTIAAREGMTIELGGDSLEKVVINYPY